MATFRSEAHRRHVENDSRDRAARARAAARDDRSNGDENSAQRYDRIAKGFDDKARKAARS